MQQMMRCLLESLHSFLTDNFGLFIRQTERDGCWVALEDSGRTGHLYGETNWSERDTGFRYLHERRRRLRRRVFEVKRVLTGEKGK